MLQLQAISKSFVAGDPACGTLVRVLDDVCLTVSSAQIVVLSGAHGSGKSTLLRCMAGLLRPDSGVRRTMDAAAIHYWAGAYDWRRVAVRDAKSPRGVHLFDEPALDFPGARAEFSATMKRLCILRHAVVIGTSLPPREFAGIVPRATRCYHVLRGRVTAVLSSPRHTLPRAVELHAHAFG